MIGFDTDNRTPPRPAGAPKLAFAFGPLELADLFEPADLHRIASSCAILDNAPLRRLDHTHARAVLAETEILVTGWGCPRLEEPVLAGAPHLRLVAHAAGSVRQLLSPGVFARGIAVTNAADANAIPVAQFTLAAILFTNKRVLDFARLYRQERRELKLSANAPPETGNHGKTVGIVGASRIGRRVMELLRPHEFTVLVHDPYLDEAGARRLGAVLRPLDALMSESAIVSLHAPSLPETRHMIDARRLALLRDGAVLINTARGVLIDQDALVRELLTGRFSAVLDVTEPEAPEADSPLYGLDNVLLTPHIAGALGGERLRFGRLIADEIARYAAGEPLRHGIDPAEFSRQA